MVELGVGGVGGVGGGGGGGVVGFGDSQAKLLLML